ncbi:MAG: hypothetical protein ABI430_00020 [Candidatus Taylorbacteria bacterium]
MKSKKTVFVSGTYELLHGGHVQFFKDAKAVGGPGARLVVCYADDATVLAYKKRKAILSEAHRRGILEELRTVDIVVMGRKMKDPIFDFVEAFDSIKPDFLVSTDDDKHADRKKEFCELRGAKYVQIRKSLDFTPISTSEMRKRLLESES